MAKRSSRMNKFRISKEASPREPEKAAHEHTAAPNHPAKEVSQKAKMHQTTIRFPEETWERLRFMSFQTKRPINEILQEAAGAILTKEGY